MGDIGGLRECHPGSACQPHPDAAGMRCPMSAEQRTKLSLAQRAYVAHDPRWPEHRRKLADRLLAALKAGQTIPGASLLRGLPFLVVNRK